MAAPPRPREVLNPRPGSRNAALSRGPESWASTLASRRSMQANRGRNTQLELALGSALHRRGLRFWKHRRPIPGLRCEADFVFPRLMLAIFVNGCFWHGCPEHATWPAANGDFWRAKIEGTRARDIRTDKMLIESGWTVVRLWEHQPIEDMAEAVDAIVCQARGTRKPEAYADLSGSE